MTNTERIQAHNAELRECIEMAEKLPEGGGGITFDDIATGGIKGDVVLSISSVSTYSFAGDAGITSLYAPNVTSIKDYAFYNPTNMASVYLPNCATIATYCFRNTIITDLSLPECTSIGSQSFYQPKKLVSIDLPKCITIGGSCFTYIASTRLTLPECTSIGNSSFTNCPNLAFVDLPKCTKFESYVLRNNKQLETLILRSETMCVGASNMLTSTKIASGTGYIYVPRALLSDDDETKDYRRATQWSKFGTQFRALEDYTVDGTITGALDESKI